MTRRKPPKKTESLEVRLPHPVKKAFMDRARSQGRTASSLVREFIDSYLAGTNPAMEKRTMLKRLAPPAALASLAAAAIALHIPTTASAAPDLKTLFERLDADRDGRLSSDEFAARDGHALHSSLRQVDLGSMMPLMIMLHSGAGGSAHATLSQDSAAMLKAAFARQDGDKDGVVSFGEFESHHLGALRLAFDTIDGDKSGEIDVGEFQAMMGHLPHETAAHVKPFGDLDGDGSGTISWSEFLG